MGRINTFPVGFQSLLGNINFGDNPSDLSDQTAAVIEQFALLAAFKVSFARNAVSVNATGNTGTAVEVPEGKVWVPITTAAIINGFDAIGDTINVGVEIRQAPGVPIAAPRMPVLQSGIVTALAINHFDDAILTWPQNVVLQGGTRFNLFVNQITTAGNISVEVESMHYEFDV